jgi:hypothetical protein
MRDDPTTRYNSICCGVHSGIPMCCIKFFVNEWPSYSLEAHREHIAKAAEINGGENYGYIPCPDCLEKGVAPVTLKSCNCLDKLLRKNGKPV